MTLMFRFEPSNPLTKNENELKNISLEIVNAGKEFNIDSAVITYWAFRESRFDKNTIGELGEIGVCQVHGVAKRSCISFGLDLRNRKDQFRCMALLMNIEKRKHRSIEKSLRVYSSGSKNKAIKFVKKRLRKINKLKQEFLKWQKEE